MRYGWSINCEEWRQLSDALSQVGPWRNVLLTPNDQDMVPTTPGIYAICAAPPFSLEYENESVVAHLATPLYIGKAESGIRTRFARHCRGENQRLSRLLQCYQDKQPEFWFVELPLTAIQDAEALLIKCFGPPTNGRSERIRGTIGAPIEA